MRWTGKSVAIPGVAALALLLAGCSTDDIEFNGGIFKAVGLGEKTKSAEPKMVARAPLVLPPNLERVPEPGTPPEGAASDVAALNDPDKTAKLSKAELERQQAEYCKKHYDIPMAHGDQTSADLASGPLGPCRNSVLTAIQKWNDADDEEE